MYTEGTPLHPKKGQSPPAVAAYHYLYIVEIFVGSVLLAVLLEIYKFVITRT
jgi:hypothetical protein